MTRFGIYLKRKLRAHGISQRQLAARADVSPNTISDWIKGARQPRPETIAKLAPALSEPYLDVMIAAGYPMDGGAGGAGARPVPEMTADELADLIATIQAQLAEAYARLRPSAD